MTLAATESVPLLPPNRRPVYTNWTRTAIQTAIEQENLLGGTIMLPAFICQDSFEPLFERCNLTPVFVDIDPSTYHMDIDLARERIGEVDAVILVHAFGLPAAMNAWVNLCNDHDVALIEDCARALGARRNERLVGSDGSYAMYSLMKVSPASKGGLLVMPESSPKPTLNRPTYGVDAWYNLFPDWIREPLSVNYPYEIESRQLDAITRRTFERYARTEYLDDMGENRANAERLRDALEPLGFEFQRDANGRIYPLVPVTTPCDRDALSHFLGSYHVPHKTLWGNPWAKTWTGAEFADRFPNSANLADRCLQFDVLNMTDEDVEFAIDRTRDFVETF
jgi:dTDP-4-amino-4,6-dideoxygalactose transaminase